MSAQDEDPDLSTIKQIVMDPSLLSRETLKKVNYNFHGPLRKSQIVLVARILVFHEPIARSGSYTRLTLVPRDLRNIVFIAFHSNPIGGHLDAVRTLHCLRLRFYWPGMYSYVVKMCNACPGCALSNPTKGKSADLVYGFLLRHPSKCFTWMPTPPARTLASKDPPHIASLVAACALLASSSRSRRQMPPLLHPHQ